jgi:hypothetical protein
MATASQQTEASPVTRANAPDLFRLTRQGALTVKTTIKSGREADLKALLATINAGVGGEGLIRFGDLRTVHFMRWVILPADPTKKIPASLVLSTNFDGPMKDHLEELVDVADVALGRIYDHCEGYNLHPPGDIDKNQLSQYLWRHRVPYAAFYVGTTGRSVNLIRKEADLRLAIQDYVDREPPGSAEPPEGIRDRIIKFVRNDPCLSWALDPPTYRAWYVFNYWLPAAILLALLAYLAAWIVVPLLTPVPWWVLPLISLLVVLLVVGAIGTLAMLVVSQERIDAVDPPLTRLDEVAELADQEDKVVQNQLTHLVNIKPQWFRPWALWVVLTLINVLARYRYINGNLGGIPTIHFARWVILDDRRLLFFSNYDGSWVNYLGDFIDKAAPGLTAIWSNTEGCPKAERLVSAGAKDEQRFKAWTRNHQIPTDVWYSAYPDLTVDNINNNSFIRIGLAYPLSREEIVQWLSRL